MPSPRHDLARTNEGGRARIPRGRPRRAMRANWFFAFPLDGSFVSSLPAPPPLFRLFHPDDVHVTLSFLGACGEVAARRGLAALDGALSERPVAAIEVSLANVVAMGPEGEYSALSALLGRGREPTRNCMLALRDRVSEAAIGRRDRRDPIPHATIARPGSRARDADRRAGLVWAAALQLGHVVARLDRVALYTWSDGARRERRFRIVAERPLGPAGF